MAPPNISISSAIRFLSKILPHLPEKSSGLGSFSSAESSHFKTQNSAQTSLKKLESGEQVYSGQSMLLEAPNGKSMRFGPRGLMLGSGGNLNPIEQAYYNARKIGTAHAMEEFVNYYKAVDPKGDWAGWVVGSTECFVDRASPLCKPELFEVASGLGMGLLRTGSLFEGMDTPRFDTTITKESHKQFRHYESETSQKVVTRPIIETPEEESPHLKLFDQILEGSKRIGKILEYPLEDGSKVLIRRDIGEDAHFIKSISSTRKIDHYNIEIQAPKPLLKRFYTTENFHIILDSKKRPTEVLRKD